MKKAAVAATVVVLVAGGYLGATALTGQRIAAAYDARIAKMEQQLPFLRVIDRQTEKGLFSSTFSGNVRVGCVPDGKGGTSDKPLVIGFKDHVFTGPLPGFKGFGAAVIESTITAPADAPEALRNYLAGMKPQDIRTEVGYGGGYKTALRLPAGDVALPAGRLSWPEVHANGTGQLDGGAVAMEGHLPELAFRGAADATGASAAARGVDVKLVNMRWKSAQTGEGSFWLRPGSSQIDIERIELSADAGDKAFSAQLGKLKYLTELSAQQDLLDAKISVTGSATLQIGKDAQPIQLDDIEFQESIKRMHGPTLQKVMDLSTADLATCGEAGSPAVDAKARGQELLNTLAQMLAHAPELSVDKLAVSYDGRRGELSYAVSAPSLTAKDLEEPGALQRQLQQKLVLRANAKLPVAWIEQIGARSGDAASAQQRVAQANTMLDLAIGQGIAVRDGDFVTSALQVERGAIMVNGKPFGR